MAFSLSRDIVNLLSQLSSIPELIFKPLVYELASGHMDSFIPFAARGLLLNSHAPAYPVVSIASKKTPQFLTLTRPNGFYGNSNKNV